jgi:Flp pilus assembly protein TadG
VSGDGLGRAEDGQALVVVGLAMFVLLGALALSIDWGYGFAMRRAAQNQSDAAARLLAVSYAGSPDPFKTTQEAAWCEAARSRDLNAGAAATTRELTVSFSRDASDWTTISDADCADVASWRTEVPADTVLVRVTTSATFTTLFGSVTRQPIQVAASARARLTAAATVRQLKLPDVATTPGIGLSGSFTKPNVAIWPIAPHFEMSKFTSSTPCGEACDPTAPGIAPMTLWPAPSDRYSALPRLLGLSHHSTRLSPTAHQLVTESDYSATFFGVGDHQHNVTSIPATNRSDRSICPDPSWDTYSNTDLRREVSCELPNRFYYGYRGSLSLGTNWFDDTSWNLFKQYGTAATLAPRDPLPGATRRQSCVDVASRPYFPNPSCADPKQGDWVETVSGGVTPNMALRMREFVARYGREVHYSDSVVDGQRLGRAVVVHVFFWDCAEQFTPPNAATPAKWVRIQSDEGRDNDCSLIDNSKATGVDRVHLFTVIPFTFYEGLIQVQGTVQTGTATVRAFWGDAFGDAGRCAAIAPPVSECALNPLNNSAFLVPDE